MKRHICNVIRDETSHHFVGGICTPMDVAEANYNVCPSPESITVVVSPMEGDGERLLFYCGQLASVVGPRECLVLNNGIGQYGTVQAGLFVCDQGGVVNGTQGTSLVGN